MAELAVISADSHMMEPANLWETRLDQKFRDDAPKVIKNERGSGYLFVAPGVRPFPVAGGFGIGKSGEELKEHLHRWKTHVPGRTEWRRPRLDRCQIVSALQPISGPDHHRRR